MAFTVVTEDPSARDVGDLIIIDDRVGYVDDLGLIAHHFVNKAEEKNDNQELEKDGRFDGDAGVGREDSGGGEEDEAEAAAEGVDERTESQRA